jgi:predicted nucleic acid-binding protein
MVAHLRHSILLTELPALPNDLEIADPADLFLLAMAMGSQADYLVTGDRRSGLLGLGHWGRTRIVSLSAFCTEVL